MLVAALAWSVCAPGVEAVSLKVSPGRFLVTGVRPGTPYDLHKETGVRITIFNDDDVRRTWAVSTHRPSERGLSGKVYSEIPDPGWCRFEEDRITVEPRSQAHAHVHLEIPDREEYYNQQWEVILVIGSPPGGPGIGLAVNVRLLIETAARSDPRARPAGALGLEPSVLRFEGVRPGKRTASRTAVLYNNESSARSYSVTSLFEDDAIDERSFLTGGYGALPDSAWIRRRQCWLRRKRTVRIAAGGSKALRLRVRVPDDPDHFGKRWEEILWIQPEGKRGGFVRVQIDTIKKAEAD